MSGTSINNVLRTQWRSESLNQVAQEPWLWSLLKYRKHRDVVLFRPTRFSSRLHAPNLISSVTSTGTHLPILDLDYPHEYVGSSTPGHGHLYLNVEIPTWRWVVLQLALWLAKVQEPGYSVWSLRRAANFVRLPSVQKTAGESDSSPSHGWIRKL